MNDLVSVIIPVYNVEYYLAKCVDSVLEQDYRPLEIILIDDGSTDGSGQICDDYDNKYEEIKVIHKQNGGLSDARNYGIAASTGSYICCIDSDDYIDDGFITYLMSLIHKYNADMSICNISYVENDVITNPVKERKEYCANASQILEKILDEVEITESACAKMYKNELFEDVRYPIGRTEEDLATTYKLIGQCDKIAYGNDKSYYYINRSDSITKRKFSEANYNIIWAFDGMKKYVMERYPELRESCLKRECSVHMRLLQKATLNAIKDERITNARKNLRKLSVSCFRNPKANVSEKIRFFLVAYFPNIYLFCYKSYKKVKILYLKK